MINFSSDIFESQIIIILNHFPNFWLFVDFRKINWIILTKNQNNGHYQPWIEGSYQNTNIYLMQSILTFFDLSEIQDRFQVGICTILTQLYHFQALKAHAKLEKFVKFLKGPLVAGFSPYLCKGSYISSHKWYKSILSYNMHSKQ